MRLSGCRSATHARCGLEPRKLIYRSPESKSCYIVALGFKIEHLIIERFISVCLSCILGYDRLLIVGIVTVGSFHIPLGDHHLYARLKILLGTYLKIAFVHLGGIVMSLHTHTVDPGTVGFFNCIDKIHDAYLFGNAVIIIIIVVKIQIFGRVFICKSESIYYELITFIHMPPA